MNVKRTAICLPLISLTNQNDNILIVKLEIEYCSYKIEQVKSLPLLSITITITKGMPNLTDSTYRM